MSICDIVEVYQNKGDKNFQVGCICKKTKDFLIYKSYNWLGFYNGYIYEKSDNLYIKKKSKYLTKINIIKENDHIEHKFETLEDMIIFSLNNNSLIALLKKRDWYYKNYKIINFQNGMLDCVLVDNYGTFKETYTICIEDVKSAIVDDLESKMLYKIIKSNNIF